MNNIEALESAYRVIEKPQNWCQFLPSIPTTNIAGEVTGYAHCLSSAIWQKAGTEMHIELMMKLALLTPYRCAISYNDRHKHWQVLRLLRLAIAQEKAGGNEARKAARRRRQLVIAMRDKALGHVAELAHA